MIHRASFASTVLADVGGSQCTSCQGSASPKAQTIAVHALINTPHAAQNMSKKQTELQGDIHKKGAESMVLNEERGCNAYPAKKSLIRRETQPLPASNEPCLWDATPPSARKTTGLTRRTAGRLSLGASWNCVMAKGVRDNEHPANGEESEGGMKKTFSRYYCASSATFVCQQAVADISILRVHATANNLAMTRVLPSSQPLLPDLRHRNRLLGRTMAEATSTQRPIYTLRPSVQQRGKVRRCSVPR